MDANPSSFYDDELRKMKQIVMTHFEELNSLENKLAAIIKRNSIVDIAAKVEVYQLMVDKITSRLRELNARINEMIVQSGSSADKSIENTENNNNEQLMKDIHLELGYSEKEFDDVSYYCKNFIEETLK